MMNTELIFGKKMHDKLMIEKINKINKNYQLQ